MPLLPETSGSALRECIDSMLQLRLRLTKREFQGAVRSILGSDGLIILQSVTRAALNQPQASRRRGLCKQRLVVRRKHRRGGGGRIDDA